MVIATTSNVNNRVAKDGDAGDDDFVCGFLVLPVAVDGDGWGGHVVIDALLDESGYAQCRKQRRSSPNTMRWQLCRS